MKRKNVYIIAGPNGAGKTTFAKEFLPKYAECPNFVNADLIAQGVAPFSPERAALRAGKLLLDEIHRLSKGKEDFAFETTLAGKSYVPFIKELKQKDFRVHLFFLWMPNVDMAIQRVKQRVALGGHSIPELDIRRRFKRGIQNFLKAYQDHLDSWYLFDNSSDSPKLIGKHESGKLEIKQSELYEQIIQGMK